MKRIKLVLIIVILFCGITSKAQVINLRIDSLFLTDFPNSTHVNDTFSVNITIHNDSSVLFTGRVYIGSQIGSQVTNDTSSIDSVLNGPFYYPTYAVNESIPAGGSILRSLVVSVLNPPFIIGSSGVVIWPIIQNNGNFISSIDSLRTTVTVLHPLGINEPDDKKLKAYISGQQLIIQEDDQYLLKNVKLYDVAGVLLAEQKISTSGFINMEPYASGIYFAEVNYADNTRCVIKVFNTR